jgi:MFS family permease
LENTRLVKKPGIFYGYWIVVATFFCLFIETGIGFATFGIFVNPLGADFGWSRGGIMVAFTIRGLLAAIASPFIGKVVDRYGARKVIFIGALIGGIGFLFLSRVSALWHFYVGWAVVGLGMTALGIIPASTVVSNWFKRKRGLAIGIMTAGIGSGVFALSPLIGGYLIPNFGWSTGYLASAILTWGLIIPLALLVIKEEPADMGLYPDGVEAHEVISEAKSGALISGGLTLKMALATSTFWLITIAILLTGFSQIGVMQSQVPYLEDVGFPAATAAGALGGVGLSSVISKFGWGWLCDRIPVKYVYASGMGLQLVSFLILMNIGPASSQGMVWLYAGIMGLGMSTAILTQSLLISTNFGLASYGVIFGVVSLVYNVGSVAGPLAAGYMYDITNAYHLVFIIFIVLGLIAIPAVLMTRRPKLP